MSVFTSLFSKKKKSFKAFCNVSKEPLEEGFGYLLTTAEVVQSRKYWDNIMTEPETLSYTINHFAKQDQMATQIRSMIFDKHSQRKDPWMVSDTYIGWFNVDKDKARELARNWWAEEGEFAPENSGAAEENLSEDDYSNIKEYAIMQAGRDRIDI